MATRRSLGRARELSNWDDDETRYEVEERRQVIDPVGESFDRLAFARRAVRILNPRTMAIGIYEGRSELRIERGRDWAQIARGEANATWATVGIPRGATRQHIALALAELAGVAHIPYVVDLLVAAGNLVGS